MYDWAFCNFRSDPWAMDRTKVIVEYDRKLGSGAFCNVHKGHINGPAAVKNIFPDLISVQKFVDCDVAVKLLPSFADDIARSDFNQVFLIEYFYIWINILSNFDLII